MFRGRSLGPRTLAGAAEQGGQGGNRPLNVRIGERLSSPRSMLRYVILLNIHDGDRL